MSYISRVIVLSLMLITSFIKLNAQCTTDVVACDLSTNPTFTFVSQSPGTSSSCLELTAGHAVAYITTYVSQSGNLNMLIDGDASTGFLDVAVYNIPGGMDPCVAIQDIGNEIQCNFADFSNGCNQLGNAFSCTSTVPAPAVVAGQTLMIVVENWSGDSTNFTIQLGNTPDSAQFAPPDATINPAGPFCYNDQPYKLTAVNNGGNWSGPGVVGDFFNPSIAGAGIHTITYSIGSGACTSPSETIQIEVKPSPNIPSINTTNFEYCVGDTIIPFNVIADSNSILNWYNSAIGGVSTSITPTFSTAFSGSYNYWVSQTNDVGCESPRQEIIINVYDVPSDPDLLVVQNSCSVTGSATIQNYDSNLIYELR